MARTKKRIFDGLYAQLEETDGNVVLVSAKGEPSVIFEITNPVQQLCTDAEQYMLFQDVLSNVVQTLGEGYALQKQDVLCKQSYHHEVPEDAEFLTKSYFRYFEGREFTEIRTYLILTQEAQRSQFVQYDPKKWLDFHSKVSKVSDILKEKNIKHWKLTKEEVNEYCHRFMAFQFRHGPFSMTNFKASDEYLKIGDRVVRSYPLVDIDEINLPSQVKPYTQMNINGYGIATDLFSFLTSVPHADCVVFNQVVQIPNQRKLLRKLQAKAKRHGSMPDPSNKIAKEDIEEVLDRLAVQGQEYCLPEDVSGQFDRTMEEVPFTEDEQKALLRMLTYVIDFRSSHTVTHTITTTVISEELAVRMLDSGNDIRDVICAAMLHDLGKIGIPMEILEFPGKLSPQAMRVMRTHVDLTGQILGTNVSSRVRDIALRHHEKLDGSGYPRGLSAVSLDMPQRIVAVADIISALTGTRSYKDAFSKEKTVSILKDMADNGLIDSMIVSMFVENYDTIMGAVRRRSQPILDKYHEMQRQYQVLERRMEDRNSQAAAVES